MANATHNAAPGVYGISNRITEMHADIKDRLERYSLFRETRRELNALSNRELADLGISRASINQIARDAAYGH